MKGKVIIMAKMTKETMMKKLGALEDKLFDLIPENEEGTSRVGILDRVSGIVSGEVKATLAEMTAAFNEGTGLLAVEAEVKKQTKAAKKAEESEVKEEPVEEEPVEEKPKKKVMKKKSVKTANTKEDKPVPVDKKEVSKKTSKKSEKKEETFKFPEVLKTAEDGDYKLTEIKSLTDIEDNDLIACKFTEEDLQEFEYDYTGKLGQPTKFDEDVDVLMVMDAYEDKIVYASSLGTHKMYHFFEEDVKKMTASGMPWRVYKPVA